jgi:hypothetical protein
MLKLKNNTFADYTSNAEELSVQHADRMALMC